MHSKICKEKKKLYKSFLINPSDKNKSLYKKYKNKLNHTIKMAKKMYYEEELVKYKCNTKMLWKTLNEILNKSKNRTKLSKSFFRANKTDIITDPKEIATNFNEYFTNVGPNLARNIISNNNKSFNEYLTGNYKSSMFVEPITEYELENEINIIKPNKSCGYDGINASILKAISKIISKPLTHIFNLTFQLGIIPDKLKIALVTPTFKGNEEK